MAGPTRPKTNPCHTLFPDSVLYEHTCPLHCWANASQIFQTTVCRVGWTEHVAHAKPTGVVRITVQQRMVPAPKGSKKESQENSYTIVRAQRMEEQSSKASTHQSFKVKHFAAYQRATWETLSGSQVPNIKQSLKKTIKRAKWNRWRHSIYMTGQCPAYWQNDLSGKMAEEQKVTGPDELDLYISVFLNLGNAGVCGVR